MDVIAKIAESFANIFIQIPIGLLLIWFVQRLVKKMDTRDDQMAKKLELISEKVAEINMKISWIESDLSLAKNTTHIIANLSNRIQKAEDDLDHSFSKLRDAIDKNNLRHDWVSRAFMRMVVTYNKEHKERLKIDGYPPK
jgi:Na+/phosphate symporter